LNLRVRGPCVVLPVKARRAKPENAFHRIENLQAETRRPCTGRLLRDPAHAHRFAFYPSAPHVSGATNFLLASALSASPTGLATSRWRRRAMRPTDVCHPNELRAPAPRAFPAPFATCAAGTPREVLGFARHDRGSRRFTASEDRFGGSSSSPNLARLASRLRSGAWAFSSHGASDRSNL
jgi:hypothetical protein